MSSKQVSWLLFALEGVGAVFVGLFLIAYLGGLFFVPQTTVLHSIPEIKSALAILGGILLVLIFSLIAIKFYQIRKPVILKQGFVTPLKVGLLIVAITYFLFTLHQTFMFTWVGEWEYLAAGNPEAAMWIFITDIQAYVFLLFRFIAGIIGVSGAILYFAKKGLPQSTVYKLLRTILIFEGLYWLGLLTSGIWGSLPTSAGFNIIFLLNTGLPCLVGSIGISASLFLLSYNLSTKKPAKAAIKWALIAGIFYIITLWLNNTGMWITTISGKGIDWLFTSPESLISFATTAFGLLALAIYTIYFAKKSSNTQDWTQLKLGTIGALITALGLFFLWNYLTWIFFDGWNEWYAWILGHNLDLWMLSLPLAGLPLLFYRKQTEEKYE